MKMENIYNLCSERCMCQSGVKGGQTYLLRRPGCPPWSRNHSRITLKKDKGKINNDLDKLCWFKEAESNTQPVWSFGDCFYYHQKCISEHKDVGVPDILTFPRTFFYKRLTARRADAVWNLAFDRLSVQHIGFSHQNRLALLRHHFFILSPCIFPLSLPVKKKH